MNPYTDISMPFPWTLKWKRHTAYEYLIVKTNSLHLGPLSQKPIGSWVEAPNRNWKWFSRLTANRRRKAARGLPR